MFCFLLSQIAVSEFLDIYPKACSDAKRWALFSLHTNIHCDPSADLKYLAYLFYTIHSFPFIYLRRDIGLAHWPSNVTTILLVASTIRFKWVLYLCLPSLITHSFFLKWRMRECYEITAHEMLMDGAGTKHSVCLSTGRTEGLIWASLALGEFRGEAIWGLFLQEFSQDKSVWEWKGPGSEGTACAKQCK